MVSNLLLMVAGIALIIFGFYRLITALYCTLVI